MTKRGRGQRRSRRLKNRSVPKWWHRGFTAVFGRDWAAVYVAFSCEPRKMGVA